MRAGKPPFASIIRPASIPGVTREGGSKVRSKLHGQHEKVYLRDEASAGTCAGGSIGITLAAALGEWLNWSVVLLRQARINDSQNFFCGRFNPSCTACFVGNPAPRNANHQAFQTRRAVTPAARVRMVTLAHEVYSRRRSE
jgi:hypothetical protein